MEALHSLFALRWRQEPQIRPLPEPIERTFVPSPVGDLELLVSTPKAPDSSAPAIFFVHGGYGSAGVWLEWMAYLRDSGYAGTLYAYSARNHGASYSVPYLRMVYGTSLDDMASDLQTCLDFARKRESGSDMVIIAHSSGGGLAQYALSKGLVRCRALCLVDAIPHFGALGVYANWAKHDPWFMLRCMFHLQHPTSPLSSPRLVHGAFFSHRFPERSVTQFMSWMPAFESMGWPMGMMGSFWAWWSGSPSWLKVGHIMRNVSGRSDSKLNDRVCFMVGSQDVLMDIGMCRRQAAEYRTVLGGVDQKPVLDPPVAVQTESVTLERSACVRLVIIKDAGHHLQNDLQRDVGAAALLDFIRQS